MLILAIETSCDDTGVALLDIKKSQTKILADFVSSQTQIHAPYGGVVPNLAVRAHYKNLSILLEQALRKIDVKKIDLIAVTNGPGLEPCLWAGVNTAKVLAMAMRKPIVGVNHLEGHIAANWLQPIGGISNFELGQVPRKRERISNKNSKLKNSKIDSKWNKFLASESKIQNSLFPVVCLIVSGGHTQLVLIKDIGKYKILGQTRDDAAGEAFDKVAKMFGLGYPGGPRIALKAQNGDSGAFELPRPMIGSNDYDFSFSGLKTAVLYLLKKMNNLDGDKVNNLCASFQQAVIDVLIDKTIRAAREYKAKTVMLSGGVAANQELRRQMNSAIKRQVIGFKFLVPDFQYCTDNAMMIGLAGYWKYQRQGANRIKKIIVNANLNF